MIVKKDFHTAVMDMQYNPSDDVIRDRYFAQVQHMSEIIAKSYRVASIEDAIQDLIEYSIIKRLHERIKPDQNAFSYYWKSLSQHAWTINKKMYKNNVVVPFDMWENSYSDEGLQEELIMEKLDWSLEDYDISSKEEFVNNMEEVIVTKGTRGRPKMKADGEKASHWEYLFKALKREGTMTEDSMVHKLPQDKQKSLKNPSKSIEYYMKAIARRDGHNLSISNNGKETIYMVLDNG